MTRRGRRSREVRHAEPLEERLLQCCVHVGTEGERGHQCAPFCAVQAWPALSAQVPARARSAATA